MLLVSERFARSNDPRRAAVVTPSTIMSLKAKDLTYNKEQPAFLQRLRAQHGGDRSNVQFARPKKDRLKTGDADEDEPTIVDEEGETVAKAEWEERVKTEHDRREADVTVRGEDLDNDGRQSETIDTAEAAREKQQVAGIGTGKKRKAAKVFADDFDGEKERTADQAIATRTNNDTKVTSTSQEPNVKPKKKGKKIKLSFDEPD